MSVVAIAIVNKDNSPLMIRTRHDYDTVNSGSDKALDEENQRMKLIFLLHASLDVIDEKQNQLNNREPYLGLLNQCESYKIFGLLSTTRVKVVAIISSGTNQTIRDLDAKTMLKQIHSCYIQSTVNNPFYPIGQEITSRSVEAMVEQILSK